ncbi:rhoptry-associated membrane antigen, putative [Plasmodium vinckei brucechwatti]|uniref:Rhoptry-associated membrane antigen, putative n=1 Tax=Plasmodium vinckei brucechwatti TaxID=119398 RepID=A0A6V7S5X9_PLAVN|nr:rhoptry-associated membrane antigen, putative [Plasmodium vinckei brucechwatti]
MKILLSLLVFQNITKYFDNFKNAGIIESNGGNIQYINENIFSSININGISRQLNDDIELSKYNLITDKYYYDSNAQKDYYDAKEFAGDLKFFEVNNDKGQDNKNKESLLKANNENGGNENGKSFLETDEYDEEADNEKDEDNEYEESFLETDEYDEEADNEKDEDEHDESFLEADEYDEEADNENDEDNKNEESFLEADEYDDDNENDESFLETDEYDEEADNEKDEDNEYEESFLETDEYDEEADNEKDEDEHDESFLEAGEYDEESDNEKDEDMGDDNYANNINSSITAQSFIETNDIYSDDLFDSEETIKDAVKKGSTNKNLNASSINDNTKNMIKKLNKTGSTEFKNNKQSLRSQNKNSTKSNLEDIKAKNAKNNMDQINLEEYGISNDELSFNIMPDAFDALAPKLHKNEKLGNESTKYKLKSSASAKNPKHVPYKRGENPIYPHIHADAYKKNKKLDEILEEYEQELSSDDMMELENHNEENTPVIADTDDADNDDDSNEPNSSSISFLSSLTLIILGLLYIMN